jgi:hypothetical protein
VDGRTSVIPGHDMEKGECVRGSMALASRKSTSSNRACC